MSTIAICLSQAACFYHDEIGESHTNLALKIGFVVKSTGF